MRHTVTGTAVAVATSTFAIGLVAAPAQAAERSIDDARNDVSHGVDLQSVRVVNEKNVRVIVQHEDLVRSPESGAGMSVYLDTDRNRRGPEFAFVAGLFEGTDYALVRTRGWNLRRAEPTTAGTYRLRIGYGEDVSRIRISRAALDRPDEVRVSVRADGQQPDGGQVRDWLTSRRHLTAWVARG